MNPKIKNIIFYGLLVASAALLAYWLHNSVLTYAHPGARFGHIVDPSSNYFLSNCSRILTYTVFLSLIAGLKSIRLGFLIILGHLGYLLVSGFIVLGF